MTSTYKDIYSKFLGLIKNYDFLSLSEEEAYEFMNEWLSGTISRPKVRRLFSSISWDDDFQEVDYKLRNSIDEQYDKAFTEFLLANGMVVGWLTPRVRNNDLLINQLFATKEQNFFSQANHVTAIQQLYDEACNILDKDYGRDHGYSYFSMYGEIN